MKAVKRGHLLKGNVQKKMYRIYVCCDFKGNDRGERAQIGEFAGTKGKLFHNFASAIPVCSFFSFNTQ